MPLIQERIYTVATPAISPAKIYPDVAPDDTRADHVVYFGVASSPENTLSSGVAIDSGRYQFDCWSQSRLGARTLANALVAGLAAAVFPANFSATVISINDDFDMDTKMYRTIVDMSLWFY